MINILQNGDIKLKGDLHLLYADEILDAYEAYIDRNGSIGKACWAMNMRSFRQVTFMQNAVGQYLFQPYTAESRIRCPGFIMGSPIIIDQDINDNEVHLTAAHGLFFLDEGGHKGKLGITGVCPYCGSDQ